MPRPKKAMDKASRAARRQFAQRVQAAIRARWASLYAFQKANEGLAGRVATWMLPQRKKPVTNADVDAIVMPDAASLAAFCRATGVSADWLLGLRGADDAPEFVGMVRPLPALEEELGEYVRCVLAERIHAQPLEGRGAAPTRGPLELADGAGAKLLTFVVEAAERALRASYPLAVIDRIATQLVVDAVARLEAEQSDATIRAASYQGAAAQALREMRKSLRAVPLAEAPPVRVVGMIHARD